MRGLDLPSTIFSVAPPTNQFSANQRPEGNLRANERPKSTLSANQTPNGWHKFVFRFWTFWGLTFKLNKSIILKESLTKTYEVLEGTNEALTTLNSFLKKFFTLVTKFSPCKFRTMIYAVNNEEFFKKCSSLL